MMAPAALQESGTVVCECGHPLAEHAESGWGPHTVCVEKLPDENDGWHGVCPCVRYDCEHGYLAAGGLFDCPACEASDRG